MELTLVICVSYTNNHSRIFSYMNPFNPPNNFVIQWSSHFTNEENETVISKLPQSYKGSQCRLDSIPIRRSRHISRSFYV